MFKIFWDFLTVEQNLFSPQVKQIVIISNKLVFTSGLTSRRTISEFRILENWAISEKPIAWPAFWNAPAKIPCKIEIEHCPKWAISHEN